MGQATEVQLFYNQLIAKPGNKTTKPLWPDPYFSKLVHILQKNIDAFIVYLWVMLFWSQTTHLFAFYANSTKCFDMYNIPYVIFFIKKFLCSHSLHPCKQWSAEIYLMKRGPDSILLKICSTYWSRQHILCCCTGQDIWVLCR